ncbi:MAG TPA: Ig-like domain-containing protein [Gemmatimonadales bacterium]
MCLSAIVALGLACLDDHGIPGYQESTVTGVLITPPVASLSPGDHVQFKAEGVTNTGDSVPIAVVWSARYGRITPVGFYTAPASGQEDVVTARVQGTAYTDSAVVSLLPAPVGGVQVTPATADVPVGMAAQLTATVFDSSGDTLHNHSVVWAASDSSVVAVTQTGLVRAVAVGNATVTAATGGHQGSSAVTVEPPKGGSWPNEPANYQLISEQPFDVLNLSNWNLQFGTAVVIPDASAPFSPPDALEVVFPVGFVGGSAPGTMELTLPQPVHSMYVGIWWKPSNPWQGNDSNSNKIQYVFTNASGSAFMVMYGTPGGPYELRVFPQFSTSSDVWLTPNVANVPVTLGQWHRIEWLLIDNTTTDPPNGICRWWLDGQLIGDYTNVNYPSEPFSEYKVAPVFGGNGGPKIETDYYWYDHIHLSGR